MNPLLTGGFPYRRSTVRNCVVWLMHFALLAERWYLIKGSHIAGPVCGVSICSNPHHKRTEALMSFSRLSKWAVEQTVEMQVSRKLMKFRLCYCYVICHSVIDGIIAPVWNHWSPVDSRCKGSLELNFGGPVCGDSIAGGFLSQKLGLMFSFMFALKSCLTNSGYASELKSQDAYAMLFNPTFRMVEHQDN